MENELGKLLRELRGKTPLREVATKTELSHTYIRDLELGINRSTKAPIKPSPDTLKRLSEAYNYSYNKLMEIAGYIGDNEPNLSVFSERLAVGMKKSGLDPKDVAEKCNVSVHYIQKLLVSPSQLPGSDTLNKLAELIDVTSDYLAGYTDDPNGYGTRSYPTDKPDLKKMLETQPLRYNGVELSPEEQEIITAHVRMAYDLIKKSNKIRAAKRRKKPSEE